MVHDQIINDSVSQHQKYYTIIFFLLQDVLEDIEGIWLEGWKCLLTGQSANENERVEVEKMATEMTKEMVAELKLCPSDEIIGDLKALLTVCIRANSPFCFPQANLNLI